MYESNALAHVCFVPVGVPRTERRWTNGIQVEHRDLVACLAGDRREVADHQQLVDGRSDLELDDVRRSVVPGATDAEIELAGERARGGVEAGQALARLIVATVVNRPLMNSSLPTSFMSRTTPLTPPALNVLTNEPLARLMRATLRAIRAVDLC